MRIAVAGCGVVGGAVADGMERLGHEVFRHDPKLFCTTARDVYDFKPGIIFVCVPTPQNLDGSCNTSIVELVIDELMELGTTAIIAIKSTVEPGTTRRLMRKYTEKTSLENSKIVFVPEFLREKSAFYDFTEGHDTCVIGTYNENVYLTLKHAHGHYPKKFFKVTPTEAELVKYYSNVFNAMRIVFANGFYDICKKLKADYSKVKEAATSRPTITDLYLDCNENFRGFAGVCLPKDTAAIAHLAEKLDVDAKIFEIIVEDNKLYKPTVFDGMRME